MLKWTALCAAALMLAALITAAREMLRSERHCRMVATIAVDCK